MNGSWYSMLGTSKIIEDKNDKLLELKKYTLAIYSKGLPKMDNQDIMEKISIINNRMKRLKKLSLDNSPNFYSLYYITIEKIRRFYHSIHGLPKINTSKIYRVYKCDEYRKSYFPGEFVSDEFKKLYFDLIETEERDKKVLFEKLEKFYDYVKDGRKLDGEFRLKIKSRNE